MSEPSIIERATEFARSDAAGRDASHDMLHVERVMVLATKLAAAEDITNVEPVQLGTRPHGGTAQVC
jgi:HD superfamily phosphodiesterase